MDNTKPPEIPEVSTKPLEMPKQFKWLVNGMHVGVLLHLTSREAQVLSSVLDITEAAAKDPDLLTGFGAAAHASVAETKLVIASIQERLKKGV